MPGKTRLDKVNCGVDSEEVELSKLASRCKEEFLLAIGEAVDLDKVENGRVCTLKLKGRLVSGEPVQQFDAAFQSALTTGHVFLVLDLESMPYMDSSGIGALVNALKSSSKAGGTARLVNPTPFVEKTLKMCGLLGLFSVHESEADAVAACGG